MTNISSLTRLLDNEWALVLKETGGMFKFGLELYVYSNGKPDASPSSHFISSEK